MKFSKSVVAAYALYLSSVSAAPVPDVKDTKSVQGGEYHAPENKDSYGKETTAYPVDKPTYGDNTAKPYSDPKSYGHGSGSETDGKKSYKTPKPYGHSSGSESDRKHGGKKGGRPHKGGKTDSSCSDTDAKGPHKGGRPHRHSSGSDTDRHHGPKRAGRPHKKGDTSCSDTDSGHKGGYGHAHEVAKPYGHKHAWPKHWGKRPSHWDSDCSDNEWKKAVKQHRKHGKPVETDCETDHDEYGHPKPKPLSGPVYKPSGNSYATPVGTYKAAAVTPAYGAAAAPASAPSYGAPSYSAPKKAPVSSDSSGSSSDEAPTHYRKGHKHAWPKHWGKRPSHWNSDCSDNEWKKAVKTHHRKHGKGPRHGKSDSESCSDSDAKAPGHYKAPVKHGKAARPYGGHSSGSDTDRHHGPKRAHRPRKGGKSDTDCSDSDAKGAHKGRKGGKKSYGGHSSGSDTDGKKSYGGKKSGKKSGYGSGSETDGKKSYGNKGTKAYGSDPSYVSPTKSYGDKSSYADPTYGGKSSYADPTYGGKSSYDPPTYGDDKASKGVDKSAYPVYDVNSKNTPAYTRLRL